MAMADCHGGSEGDFLCRSGHRGQHHQAFDVGIVGAVAAVRREDQMDAHPDRVKAIGFGAPRAFEAGVRHAASSDSAGFLNDIFTTRSGVLLGAFPPEEIEDRLSGLIIGREVMSGLALGWTDGPPLLFGDDALCTRYARAFEILGRSVRRGGEDATVEGFRRLNALPPTDGA